MAKIWVVVADSGTARFFEAESRIGGIREFDRMDHSSERLRPDERLRSGRLHKEREDSPKEHEARLFARELAQRLADEQRLGTYQRLVIAAAPRFLGHLRTCLTSPVRATVAGELPKDLVNTEARRVRRSLPERL